MIDTWGTTRVDIESLPLLLHINDYLNNESPKMYPKYNAKMFNSPDQIPGNGHVLTPQSLWLRLNGCSSFSNSIVFKSYRFWIPWVFDEGGELDET